MIGCWLLSLYTRYSGFVRYRSDATTVKWRKRRRVMIQSDGLMHMFPVIMEGAHPRGRGRTSFNLRSPHHAFLPDPNDATGATEPRCGRIDFPDTHPEPARARAHDHDQAHRLPPARSPQRDASRIPLLGGPGRTLGDDRLDRCHPWHRGSDRGDRRGAGGYLGLSPDSPTTPMAAPGSSTTASPGWATATTASSRAIAQR